MNQATKNNAPPAMELVAHDYQLRSALKDLLLSRLGPQDRLVDELRLAFGTTRADLALVNGNLEAFEIKAAKDNLHRLPGQVAAYDKVFQFSWVVTTKEHLRDIRALVPKRWGLMVATGDNGSISLKPVREAKRNPHQDSEHLARLLWRDELLKKLHELGLARGLKSKSKVALYAALASAMRAEELSDYVRSCMKARVDWRADFKPSKG